MPNTFRSKTEIVNFTSEDLIKLRRDFESLNEETTFNENIKLASIIACLGLHREIGTVNDELSKFIFDADSKTVVPLSSLKSSIVKWNNKFGVVITSTASQKLELRSIGFYDMIHPLFSKNQDGTLHSLYIFPEIINEIMNHEKIELVIVKSWGKNTIFEGFEPAKSYYQTNLWEIENNDALKFSDLIRRGRIAFLGTHDLIAHIAGANEKYWPQLKKIAEDVHLAIENYFSSVKKPTIAALILPYTIGVILDDLAQPSSYGSESHILVLYELLRELSQNSIPPDLKSILIEFPQSFEAVIKASRNLEIVKNISQVKNYTNQLIFEIKKSTIVF